MEIRNTLEEMVMELKHCSELFDWLSLRELDENVGYYLIMARELTSTNRHVRGFLDSTEPAEVRILRHAVGLLKGSAEAADEVGFASQAADTNAVAKRVEGLIETLIVEVEDVCL